MQYANSVPFLSLDFLRKHLVFVEHGNQNFFLAKIACHIKKMSWMSSRLFFWYKNWISEKCCIVWRQIRLWHTHAWKTILCRSTCHVRGIESVLVMHSMTMSVGPLLTQSVVRGTHITSGSSSSWNNFKLQNSCLNAHKLMSFIRRDFKL